MAEARMSETPNGSGARRSARASAPRAASTETEKKEAASHEPACPVAFCPIGMALTTVQQAGPEVVEHLMAAAREFLLAARAAIDARAGGLERRESPGLERIEIG